MNSDFKFISLLVFISFAIVYYFLPGYFLHPNSYLMAQGGDALVIYFDMVFQVCHNSDYIHFYGMNYPFGESLILTDAQAAVTITLKFINENLFSICHLVPGIVHSLILLFIPLTSVFLYLILTRLQCSKIQAMFFALLIAFLSPQLLRVTGHFGLAYPFLIPMTIYWFFDKYESTKFNWRDLAYLFILYFFFINNPYVGFSAAGLFLISATLVLLVERNRKGAILVLAGLIPIILGYISVKLSDPFDDRILRQWGFFHYFASIGGLFFPKGSLLYDIFNPSQYFGEVRFEGKINVGLVTTITLISYFFLVWTNKIFNKRINVYLPVSFKYVFWGSLVMFIYAANYSLYGFAKKFMEENMGTLLMFKASGRLAWPFYYGLTLMSTLILTQFYRHYKPKKWSLWAFMIVPIIIWAYEDFQFLQSRYKDIYYDNLFNDKNVHASIEDLGINKTEYEALYLIPVIQTWNDKFLFELDFKTQRAALVISAYTGIPLINGMLSRAPLETSISAIQLASNPVIKRARLPDLPQGKYLIVYGNQKQVLSAGEKLLLSRGKVIGDILGAKILQIDKSAFNSIPVLGENTSDNFIHHSWDHELSPVTLTSPGAIGVSVGNRTLFSDSLTIFNNSAESIEISLWHYLDFHDYRIPRLTAIADGKEYSFYNRSSKDFVGYWVRQHLTIPMPKYLEIKSESDAISYFDDLHIQTLTDTTSISIGDVQLWNNYPILDEDRFTLIK